MFVDKVLYKLVSQFNTYTKRL